MSDLMIKEDEEYRFKDWEQEDDHSQWRQSDDDINAYQDYKQRVVDLDKAGVTL